jgi:hypothetical protein
MTLPFKILLVHNYFRKEDAVTYVSLIIRKATKSEWNHVAVQVRFMGREYVVESIFSGVHIRSYDKWKTRSDRVVKEMVPSGELRLSAFNRLMDLVHEPYGYVDLFTIGWILLLGVVRLRPLSSPKNSQGLPCTEVAGRVLGVPDPHLLKPCDFESMEGLTSGEVYETRKRY